MKIVFIFCALFIGVSFADYPWPSNTFSHDKYGQHYEQHKESVSAAKKNVHDWLSQQGVTESSNNIEKATGNLEVSAGIGAGGLCTIPCESSQVAQASDTETFGSSDIGVGYVSFPSNGGNSESSSSNYASQSDYTQAAATAPIIIPTSGSNSRYSSSSRQHSERISQKAPLPIIIPSSGGSSERFSSHSEHVSETQAAQPVHFVLPSSGNTARYSSRSEHVSERKTAAQAPIIYQPATNGNSERYSSHSEHVTESKAVPVPVQLYGDSNSERYSERSDRISEQRANAPAIIPYPAPTHSRYISEQASESQQQTVPTPQYIPVYPSGSSERYRTNSERYSSHLSTAPLPVYTQPRSTSSDRYSVHSESVQEPQIYPVYPVSGGSSSRYSSSRQESVRQQHAAQPTVILPSPQRSTSSRYSKNEESSSTSAQQPQYYQPIIPTGGISSRYGLNEEYESNSNSQNGGGYIPRFGNYPNGGVYRSNRLGTSLFTDHASQGLSSYMSESERLARLQAHSVQGTGAYSGSSTVDSDFSGMTNDLSIGTGNSAGLNGVGLGGAAFVRTKSWENNAKWASGTEYDENGKPKTYSTLSTGESELHNVNGKTSGYKAATTTLENDGKVSTYSIRTP